MTQLAFHRSLASLAFHNRSPTREGMHLSLASRDDMSTPALSQHKEREVVHPP
ncbi:MAG: hypothetical protein ACRDDA_02435 [Aeromonas sp.]